MKCNVTETTLLFRQGFLLPSREEMDELRDRNATEYVEKFGLVISAFTFCHS